MGGCISIQVSCDQVLNRAGSCLWRKGNHIGNLEKNLVALEKSMEVLKARRDDVLTRVQREEAKGQQRLNEVQMLKEVENLKSNGVFEAVALEKPDMRCVVEERPLQPVIFGQETMLEMAWNRLMDNETAIMGLYGMGGVGKTTHLTQINNKFRETVDGVQKIQDDIAKKLGLRGEEWNQKEKIEKVTDIHARMQNKRFVLLLDDIWRKVNLTEIGVPSPTRENGCKVVFTTRSREVCGRMGVDDPMKVQCLTNNEAWHDTCSRKSYDNFKGDKIKLFDRKREVDRLLDIERAEGSNKSKVKMHDVVRDMALWISSDLGENRENCIVRAGVGLCEVPKVEKWSAVEKIINTIFGSNTDPLSFRSHFLP
ncbi:BnaCnng20410D [Brassica napus]|uniref:BnaCnng20410D protein n=1 Tax=Brassica napus TaxID=3708 RepID=A0A078IMW2_BRANA|nr:BnaCnng20410D [Brassica napus]